MNIFYTPDITVPDYILSETESKHCISVLRMKSGDEVSLTDGKGNLFKAVITGDHPKKCSLRVTETIKEYCKRQYKLHVAIAPTKNTERFEWFLEKSTEIGIDTVTPIICEHSERRNINHERLVKVITVAMKQSLSAYHPVLHPLQKFNDFIKQGHADNKYIAHCTGNRKAYISESYEKGNDAVILIGPEGDFSEKEISFAIRNGYKEITLGTSRLRTETAGIVCCSTLQVLNQKQG